MQKTSTECLLSVVVIEILFTSRIVVVVIVVFIGPLLTVPKGSREGAKKFLKIFFRIFHFVLLELIRESLNYP